MTTVIPYRRPVLTSVKGHERKGPTRPQAFYDMHDRLAAEVQRKADDNFLRELVRDPAFGVTAGLIA